MNSEHTLPETLIEFLGDLDAQWAGKEINPRQAVSLMEDLAEIGIPTRREFDLAFKHLRRTWDKQGKPTHAAILEAVRIAKGLTGDESAPSFPYCHKCQGEHVLKTNNGEPYEQYWFVCRCDCEGARYWFPGMWTMSQIIDASNHTKKPEDFYSLKGKRVTENLAEWRRRKSRDVRDLDSQRTREGQQMWIPDALVYPKDALP